MIINPCLLLNEIDITFFDLISLFIKQQLLPYICSASLPNTAFYLYETLYHPKNDANYIDGLHFFICKGTNLRCSKDRRNPY